MKIRILHIFQNVLLKLYRSQLQKHNLKQNRDTDVKNSCQEDDSWKHCWRSFIYRFACLMSNRRKKFLMRSTPNEQMVKKKKTIALNRTTTGSTQAKKSFRFFARYENLYGDHLYLPRSNSSCLFTKINFEPRLVGAANENTISDEIINAAASVPFRPFGGERDLTADSRDIALIE